MKKIVFAGAAISGLLISPALADMPTSNWNGPYLGIVAGYSWGYSVHTRPVSVASVNFNVGGWFAGGTLGYNWQSGAAVLGIEGDFTWSGADGGASVGIGFPTTTDVRWFGTLRGRAGLVANRSLIYVTGGFAFTDINARGGPNTGRNTHSGWTAGGGVETALNHNWTTKLEYLYADLGDDTTYVTIGATQVDYKTHLIRVGLNFKY